MNHVMCPVTSLTVWARVAASARGLAQRTACGASTDSSRSFSWLSLPGRAV